MEIYCKNNLLLDRAVEYSKTLGIDDKTARIIIKRLPPSFSQQGLIEHPRQLDKETYIQIWVKLNKERYVTLAHEMIHVRQCAKGEYMYENPARKHESFLLDLVMERSSWQPYLDKLSVYA